MQKVKGSSFIGLNGMSAFLLFAFISYSALSYSQPAKRGKKSPAEELFPATKVDLHEQLKIFSDNSDGISFRIALCADVPNNKKPLQVAHHQETGHVFLILQKIVHSGDTINRVFGFYPKKGLPTLFFKSITSVIKDNSYREYDAEISRIISAEQFDTIVARAKRWSSLRYHINKYNCYDYALDLFNTGAVDALPSVYVRFPFIFGKGGSPVSVYKTLRWVAANDTSPQRLVKFGALKAPLSTGRLK